MKVSFVVIAFVMFSGNAIAQSQQPPTENPHQAPTQHTPNVWGDDWKKKDPLPPPNSMYHKTPPIQKQPGHRQRNYM